MGRNTYEPQICPMAVRAGFGIDGKTPVTVSLDGNVRTWDVSTGLLLRTLENHPNYVLSAAISSDAHILAAGNLDGNVELWDVDSGGLISTINTAATTSGKVGTVYTVSLSPDGQMLAAVNGDDHSLRLWDTSSGKALNEVSGFSTAVTTVAFSPDGHVLASGAFNGPIRLWDTATRQLRSILRGHTAIVHFLAFSEAGDILTSVGDDHAFRQWEVDTGELVGEQQVGSFRSTAINLDKKLFASPSSANTVEVLDLKTNKVVSSLGARQTICLAFNFTGSELASGSSTGGLQIWDMGTGEAVLMLKGHADSVDGVTFSPDGRLLASVGDDNSLRVWDTQSGGLLMMAPVNDALGIAFSPDGRAIAVGAFDGTVRLWGVAP